MIKEAICIAAILLIWVQTQLTNDPRKLRVLANRARSLS